MNTGLPLLDYGERAKARRTDPRTSHDAAAKVDVTKGEALVIEALMRFGPMTTAEIAARVGRPRENISSRLRPLERKGMVKDSEQRRGGSIVWCAT